jgi:hypothetical protein
LLGCPLACACAVALPVPSSAASRNHTHAPLLRSVTFRCKLIRHRQRCVPCHCVPARQCPPCGHWWTAGGEGIAGPLLGVALV